MSIKLTSKAWETDQKGNDLLVLLALCDFASDEGIAFPSLDTLCKKAKVGKTTLTYILKAYEKIGVISREQRKRENKSDTSTLYKINHLNINPEKYKKAYQDARNYTKKSQCEHPNNNHNVNTQNGIVNTQTANCEHLEPSSINHQDINNHKKNIKKEKILTYLDSEKKPLLNLKAFDEWIEFKNYKYEKIGVTKLVNMLTKYPYDIQQEMIDNSIMNSYQGLFAPKQHNNYQQQKTKDQIRREQIDKHFADLYPEKKGYDFDGEIVE